MYFIIFPEFLVILLQFREMAKVSMLASPDSKQVQTSFQGNFYQQNCDNVIFDDQTLNQVTYFVWLAWTGPPGLAQTPAQPHQPCLPHLLCSLSRLYWVLHGGAQDTRRDNRSSLNIEVIFHQYNTRNSVLVIFHRYNTRNSVLVIFHQYNTRNILLVIYHQ